ncbi:MAG: transglycosylase domain-containing protein [Flavobacteriales bacterium]|nr:transglycosylase domain-containing protein [Flavobacteriales bacterium]
MSARKRAARRSPAMKAKRSGKSARSGHLLLRWALIGLAAATIGFFVLLQAVRMGTFGALPTEEELRSIRHEQATLILAEDGALIGKLFARDRTNVRYEDLPQHLINALVSTEDARFFQHAGVDGRSIRVSSAPVGPRP